MTFLEGLVQLLSGLLRIASSWFAKVGVFTTTWCRQSHQRTRYMFSFRRVPATEGGGQAKVTCAGVTLLHLMKYSRVSDCSTHDDVVINECIDQPLRDIYAIEYFSCVNKTNVQSTDCVFVENTSYLYTIKKKLVKLQDRHRNKMLRFTCLIFVISYPIRI